MVMAITKRRKKAELTQAQLAIAVGVNQSSVSQWEAGTAIPRTELLPLIAKVCHCTIDELFETENDAQTEVRDGQE